MAEAVLVAAARSPIGRANKGSLRELRADDMAAAMVQAALDQVPGLDPHEVDEILLGCAQPAGEQGYGLARVVATLVGLDDVPGVTVQRFCASSLETTRMALHAIRSGEGSVFVSAGVEAVSRFASGKADGMPGTHNPRFADAMARSQARISESASDWDDPRAAGLLPDVYLAMGQTAENVALRYGVTRAAQDEFALLSQNRAEKSVLEGFWEKDITPLTTPDGTVVGADDCPRAGTTLDGLAALKPVFRENGTITAGNCCPVNDGAAAVVVMSDVRARELGITPLARIVATGVSAISPEIMGVTPIVATQRALAHAGMTVDDLDLIEINEAFAAQVVPCIRELGLDVEKVNVHGGAIAVGHPYGMTGARTTTTLLHALEWGDKQVGLQTMCAAGGQGMAMILERLS
jgi:acetyl-CoA C-acetyltransferase